MKLNEDEHLSKWNQMTQAQLLSALETKQLDLTTVYIVSLVPPW